MCIIIFERDRLYTVILRAVVPKPIFIETFSHKSRVSQNKRLPWMIWDLIILLTAWLIMQHSLHIHLKYKRSPANQRWISGNTFYQLVWNRANYSLVAPKYFVCKFSAINIASWIKIYGVNLVVLTVYRGSIWFIESFVPERFQRNLKEVINLTGVIGSGQCHWTSLKVSHIGTWNGLVPPSNKSLPEPWLNQLFVPIWRHIELYESCGYT